MKDRVTPFADATNARTVDMAPDDVWDAATWRERYRLNDGALRARIREGDDFRYIGQDPGRDLLRRQQFDLTRSELLRLKERGVPYETVSEDEIVKAIGRP